ncbi:hypothetical protein [Spirosoma rigui]|uniref:hypothetical protein n=1 Tax=Spirosoma rigui TaxID=564064 RepID=UPI0009B06295|nr:hypothetical protein [Spirosoma rigui]
MHNVRQYLTLLLLLTTSLLRAQSTPDVRQVRWGFSPKQVKEAEARKPTSFRDEKLVYSRVPLADRNVGLDYTFNGDSLLSASYYYYTTQSVTKADVLAAQTDLKTLLDEKYGPGKAYAVGEANTVRWLTPRTQINLTLGNVDRGWSLELTYLCRVCSGTAGPQPNANWKPRKDIKDL